MRWVRIIFISLVTVLVLGGAGFLLYFFSLGGLESAIVNAINNATGDDSPFHVEVGTVKGSLLSDVVIKDIVITYHDSTGEFQVLAIPKTTASYSLSNLWDKKYIFGNLTIDDLRLTLKKNQDGDWLIPFLDSQKETSRGPIMAAIDRLSINHARLEILTPDDSMTIGDITLWGSFEADENTYAAEIRQISLRAGALDGDSLVASGRITLAGDNLVFQDLQIIHNATRLKTSGNFNLKASDGTADLVADNIDLSEISRHTKMNLDGILDLNGQVTYSDGKLSGRMNVGGNLKFVELENVHTDFSFADGLLVFDTIYGTALGNCGIDGAGSIDFTTSPKAYVLKADIKNFNLAVLLKGKFPSDLSGTVLLEGAGFKSENLRLALDVDLAESSFDGYPLHRAKGPLEITSQYLRFPGSFEVDYFENSFSVIGLINYREDMRLEIEADLPRLDRYRGKLFIDQPAGAGKARATMSGRSDNPDLSGWFASDSLWLYGLYADSAYSDFSIDRFLSGRQGYVNLDLFNGDAWNVPFDTGRSVIKVDSQLIVIESSSFANEHGRIWSRGLLDQGTTPWSLTLDTLELSILKRDFYNRSKLEVEIDSAGFNFVRTTIGEDEAALTIDGRIDFDESMVLDLSMAQIPVAPWLHLLTPDLEMDGYLSCSAHLSGSFARPVITVNGSVDSMVYRDLVLGELTANASYQDRLLTIDSLRLFSDPGVYRATGSINVDLAFTAADVDRLPDLPMNLEISARDTRFDLVSLLLPSVEDMSGDFFADFTLSGTPDEPHLDGEAYIKNGELKYFDLVDVFKTDSAGVTLVDNRIDVNDVEIYVWDDRKKRNSYAVIDGALIVKAIDSLYYDLEVSLLKEFPFKYELDDIRGVVEGELHIEGDTPPHVTGDLTIISTRYRAEFASEETGSPLMMALSGENTWDLNLNIDILSNYWIKNQDIDAEFSGFLNLIREKGRYRFIGELDIIKGKGYLFDKTFRIEPDSRVTYEDIEYPNPRLDIIATTRIPVGRFEEEEDRSDVATLAIHVTGTLDNPEFNTVEGETAFNREDILPLIVANYYGSESGSVGRFEERVSQLISSQVSQIGTRQLGVETFEIDPTYEGQVDLKRTRVTLGVQTSQNLYLYSTTNVSFGTAPELGFQARFSKAFLLEGRHDEEARYHLNLKLHWEF